MNRITLVTAAVLLFILSAARADTIVLTSGEQIDGRIAAYADDRAMIRLPDGAIRWILRAEIREVRATPESAPATTPCATCGGKGSLPCHACPTCPTCEGTGQRPCPACLDPINTKAPGRGRIPCATCQGKGTVQTTRTVYGAGEHGGVKTVPAEGQCPTCLGKAMLKCTDCKGKGMIACPGCNGTGLRATCEACGGTRKIRCAECDGAGKKTAPGPSRSEVTLVLSGDPRPAVSLIEVISQIEDPALTTVQRDAKVASAMGSPVYVLVRVNDVTRDGEVYVVSGLVTDKYTVSCRFPPAARDAALRLAKGADVPVIGTLRSFGLTSTLDGCEFPTTTRGEGGAPTGPKPAR